MCMFFRFCEQFVHDFGIFYFDGFRNMPVFFRFLGHFVRESVDFFIWCKDFLFCSRFCEIVICHYFSVFGSFPVQSVGFLFFGRFRDLCMCHEFARFT